MSWNHQWQAIKAAGYDMGWTEHLPGARVATETGSSVYNLEGQ